MRTVEIREIDGRTAFVIEVPAVDRVPAAGR